MKTTVVLFGSTAMLATLTGCGDKASTPAKSGSCRHCVYGQTDISVKSGVRELVKQHLRDPESAIFDGQANWTDAETPVIISRTSDGGVRAVCGRVNGKNGFGGYAGEQVYIVDFERDFISASATISEMQTHCLGGG